MRQAAVNITKLAERMVGTIPRSEAISPRVAVVLYRLLAKGHPVPIGRLAHALNLPDDTVRQVLSPFPVFYDEHGAVIGFGGLTVAEMPPHRFQVEGRNLYTWCAWDSLFIPGILGMVADVKSIDPLTRAPISLTVTPERVRDVRPDTTVVSFLTPDRTFDRNVIVSFCHFVHFFSSHETGQAWTVKHPNTFLLSVEDAFALGQVTNARKFGEALGR